MTQQIKVERFSGSALDKFIPDVARLRMEVFREFPYLYDGSMEYEEKYLQTYSNCPEAVVVTVFDGSRVVGAATGIPLKFEEENFKRPFKDRGYDPERIFYCAESVLQKEYRGRGLGVRFFTEREAHARETGTFDYYAFCAVKRPLEHPLRPPGYAPLDEFWRKRGYERHPELCAEYSWKDVDREEETSKTLEFWLKSPNT